MAINSAVFSYGDIKFVNSNKAEPDPEFSYGELEILYEDVLTGYYMLRNDNNTFKSNDKLLRILAYGN
jgi:hypothetical protein